MRHRPAVTYIGKGVYSLPVAEQLTGIPRQRIRRWLEGYAYEHQGSRRRARGVVRTDFGRDAGALALSFADLLEVRFLDAFLQKGVSWRSIRIAATRAAEVLATSHPFSSKIFKTDGREILLEINANDTSVADLLNLVRDQWEFRHVVSAMLTTGIDFNDGHEPTRWWPMGRRRLVVIDPTRSFGDPIEPTGGVPTRVLSSAALAEGSQRAAAEWYRVPVKAVRDAVAFERSLQRA